jgi:acyl carrier protein
VTADEVRNLFATMLQVAPSEVGDQTRPANLARWDSMQHLIVVSGFEEELGVELEPEEAAEMFSDFATFKRIILAKLESK